MYVLAEEIERGDRMVDSKGVMSTVTHTRDISGPCDNGVNFFLSVFFSLGTDSQETVRTFRNDRKVFILRNGE